MNQAGQKVRQRRIYTTDELWSLIEEDADRKGITVSQWFRDVAARAVGRPDLAYILERGRPKMNERKSSKQKT